MPKTKPMTMGEFADYAYSIPKDQQEKFNAMLGFVEEAVLEKCAIQLEKNIIPGTDAELSPTQIAFNAIWRHEAKKIRESKAGTS